MRPSDARAVGRRTHEVGAEDAHGEGEDEGVARLRRGGPSGRARRTPKTSEAAITSSKMKCRAVMQHPGASGSDNNTSETKFSTRKIDSGETLRPSSGAVPEKGIVQRTNFHGAGACLLDTVFRIAKLSMRERRSHRL